MYVAVTRAKRLCYMSYAKWKKIENKTETDKDGIKVQHTAYNGYTHMAYDGFYVNYGGADVLKCTANGLVYTGTITASDIRSTDGSFRIDKNGKITGASLMSSKGGNKDIYIGNKDMKYKLRIEIINDTTKDLIDEQRLTVKNKEKKKSNI